MTGVQRVPTGGWKVERTAWGERWVLCCQLGFIMADIVQHKNGYNWRALPDNELKMRRGDTPTFALACSAVERELAPG